MKLLSEILIAIFAAVPTAFLVGEYLQRGVVVWWILILWILCMALAIGITYGDSKKGASSGGEEG